MKRKVVYICAPYRGDVYYNVIRAKVWSREVYRRGYIPYCPHLMIEVFVDLCDGIPEQRKEALEIGKIMLAKCDELWIFGDTISEGMRGEIELAKKLKIPIKRFEK